MVGGAHMAQRSEVNRQLSGDEVEVKSLLLWVFGGRLCSLYSFYTAKASRFIFSLRL